MMKPGSGSRPRRSKAAKRLKKLRKQWKRALKRTRKAIRRFFRRIAGAHRRWRTGATILILTEENRPYFWAEWLEWAKDAHPKLHERIRLGVVPAAVGRHTRLLHAWVQDPVLERDTALYDMIEQVEAATRARGGDTINPARVLSNSRRDLTYEHLTRAGIRTPRVVDVDGSFGTDLGGLSLPIVVRQAWGHGRAMRLIETQAQLEAWLSEDGPAYNSWVATEFIDVRDPDGFYRKYRYILFGDHGVCRHIITSASWEVRPGDRVLTDEIIAEELLFLAAPCPHDAILRAAQRELEYDIAAFDYSFDADGELIMWEVNPYPDIATPSGPAAAHMGGAVEATFQGLAAMYADRLGKSGADWLRRRLLLSETDQT